MFWGIFFVQIHFLGVCWLDSLEYCKNFNIACHSVSSDLRWPSLQEPGLPQNPIATCHPWQSSCSLGARVTTQCLILLTLDNNIMRVFYWQFETNGYTNPPNDTTDFTHDKEGLSYIMSYISLHRVHYIILTIGCPALIRYQTNIAHNSDVRMIKPPEYHKGAIVPSETHGTP